MHLCDCLCKCEFHRGDDEDEFTTSVFKYSHLVAFFFVSKSVLIRRFCRF